MRALAAAVFAGLSLGHLAAASGQQGSCEAGSCEAESMDVPATGAMMMQRKTSKLAVEEAAGEIYESAGSEGWPACGGWSDAKIDEEIAKERALLPQKEKNTKMCLDGYGKKIYWDTKKVEFFKKCLRNRFGTYGMFAEEGISEAGAEGSGAFLEESTELRDAEVAESKRQGWPDCMTLTEAEGMKIIKETEAQIKKDTKFRADVCHLGPYWAKRKIDYFESCRPDDDERKNRKLLKTASMVSVAEAGELYESAGSERWPACGGWSDAKIDEEIAKERALLPQKEKNTKMCLDGYGKKIYWDTKKVEFFKKCLRNRFGTYGMFAEEGISEAGAEGGGAFIEESTELSDAEVAESKKQGWPDCMTLTEAEGMKIIKETEAQIKKDTKFRADVCHLGPYWAKRKIDYFESCRPDDDERKNRKLLKTASMVSVEKADELYESTGSEGWPACGGWSDAKIDEEIAKERALLPQKEKNTKMCLDGYGKKIYWDTKKVEFFKKCLRNRFGTYGMFAEGVSEGGAEGGGAFVEESTEHSGAEVAESKRQGWPDCMTLTEAEGMKIIKETEAQIKKDTKFRADVCHLGPYWAKRKIDYFESCRPDDDERKNRR